MRNTDVRRNRVRLNRRGRLVVAVLAAALMWVGLAVFTPSQAQSAPGAQAVSSYTVQPGDTLWGYAASITPGDGDVSDTVDRLIELNDLGGAALEAGQRLVVPAE